LYIGLAISITEISNPLSANGISAKFHITAWLAGRCNQSLLKNPRGGSEIVSWKVSLLYQWATGVCLTL